MLARVASPAPTQKGQAHLLIRDLWNVPLHLLDEERLERALRAGLGSRAAAAVWIRHRFTPHGLSLVGVGSTIRVALHTWPERRTLSFDAYGTDPELEMLFARCLDAFLT
jgi:S-adenosylmethionine/arginine decarboxylase-like enzyme